MNSCRVLDDFAIRNRTDLSFIAIAMLVLQKCFSAIWKYLLDLCGETMHLIMLNSSLIRINVMMAWVKHPCGTLLCLTYLLYLAVWDLFVLCVLRTVDAVSKLCTSYVFVAEVESCICPKYLQIAYKLINRCYVYRTGCSHHDTFKVFNFYLARWSYQ